jgi:preprotein translocase subunit SecG
MHMDAEKKWTWLLDRVLVGALGIFIVIVIALLVASVVRRSTSENEFHDRIADLQEATGDLQEAVDLLRETTDDPDIAVDLQKIDDQLEEVDEQLDVLEQSIDGITTDSGMENGAQEAEAQENFDNLLTTTAWLVSFLSIVTAITLGLVFRSRWRRKRHFLRNAQHPAVWSSDLKRGESEHKS